jgi:hypothetical protein
MLRLGFLQIAKALNERIGLKSSFEADSPRSIDS